MVRLTARGFGADEPVADNASEAGRATNRRIEFTLVAAGGAGRGGGGSTPRRRAERRRPRRRPTPPAQCCGAEIGAILAERPIQFAAGAADPRAGERAGDRRRSPTALRGCPDAAFEIGGYTDSQGSDSGNLRLSQERAEAVLAALRAPDLPLPGSTAHGYGEADPVADNATADGPGAEPAHRLHAARGRRPRPVAEGDAPRRPTSAGRGLRRARIDGDRRRAADPVRRRLGRPSRPESRRSSTRSPRRCAAARTWRWRSAGTPTRMGSEAGNQRLSQRAGRRGAGGAARAPTCRCRR